MAQSSVDREREEPRGEPQREFDLEPTDNARLANLCGPLDENLRLLESRLDVEIRRRGDNFRVIGALAESAEDTLRELFDLAKNEEVTPERNRMVDQAERWFRTKGFHVVRVRYHKNDMARIEVPLDDLPRLFSPEIRSELVSALGAFGFKFITVDLAGFRSGSLNTIISPEDLVRGVLRANHESAHR